MKVLIVDDDPFSRAVVGDLLVARDYDVVTAPGASAALEALEHDDINVVVADLDLGDGPDGVSVLCRVAEERPWVGRVVLSSHSSPQIAVAGMCALPEGTVYVVKGELTGVEALEMAIHRAIQVSDDSAPDPSTVRRPVESTDAPIITPAQANVLRLLASGATGAQIALDRGTSRRAVERMLARLYERMGVASTPGVDPKLAALRMWREGRVRLES
jgi:DNA-binding NarL/FixJ family response regulator